MSHLKGKTDYKQLSDVSETSSHSIIFDQITKFESKCDIEQRKWREIKRGSTL